MPHRPAHLASPATSDGYDGLLVDNAAFQYLARDFLAINYLARKRLNGCEFSSDCIR
jgi:hypothetical protein